MIVIISLVISCSLLQKVPCEFIETVANFGFLGELDEEDGEGMEVLGSQS